MNEIYCLAVVFAKKHGSSERSENNYNTLNVTDMYENVQKQICCYRDLNKP